MLRVLQAIAVLLLIAVLVAVNRGLAFVADWGGPDFVSGAIFGGLFVALVLGYAHWVDKREERDH